MEEKFDNIAQEMRCYFMEIVIMCYILPNFPEKGDFSAYCFLWQDGHLIRVQRLTPHVFGKDTIAARRITHQHMRDSADKFSVL